MLDETGRRALADIERRITDEDPVLALLARRLTAESQRRERATIAPPSPAAAPAGRSLEQRRSGASATVAVVCVQLAVLGVGLWALALCLTGVPYL